MDIDYEKVHQMMQEDIRKRNETSEKKKLKAMLMEQMDRLDSASAECAFFDQLAELSNAMARVAQQVVQIEFYESTCPTPFDFCASTIDPKADD